MSKALKFILLGLFLIGASALVATYEFKNGVSKTDEYRVAKVIDGDTLEIIKYDKTQKVRLIGVDTPETLDPRKPVQCFGKEASKKSKELLSGKKVRLEFDSVVGEKDKYGRTLAYVWEGNNLINLNLIREGFAHEYTYRNQNYKYQTEFKSAQAEAKNNQAGLWSVKTCNGFTK